MVMRDVTSLPAGIERQFLGKVDPPKLGATALVWVDGGPHQVKVSGINGNVVRFVYRGQCFDLPADRVTAITGAE